MWDFTRSGDIFEDLRCSLDCEFISDINSKSFRYEAYRVLASAAFTGYPLEQWQDMMEYLVIDDSITIKCEKDAKNFFWKLFTEL